MAAVATDGQYGACDRKARSRGLIEFPTSNIPTVCCEEPYFSAAFHCVTGASSLAVAMKEEPIALDSEVRSVAARWSRLQ